jgi:hypothetical protein
MSSINLSSFDNFQQLPHYLNQQGQQINANSDRINNYANNMYSNYGTFPANVNNITSTTDGALQQPSLQLNMYYSDSLDASNDSSISGASTNRKTLSGVSFPISAAQVPVVSLPIPNSSNNDESNKYQHLLRHSLHSQREYEEKYSNEDPKIHHWSSITPRASDLLNIESVKTLSTKSNDKFFGNFTSNNDFNENQIENGFSSIGNNSLMNNVRCIVFDEENNQYVEGNSKLLELSSLKSPLSVSTSSSVHNSSLNINNLRIRNNPISPLNYLNEKKCD